MPGLIKIVLTGPESSGKTTLAGALAAYYHTTWVPEYARDYLTEQGGHYGEKDLTIIAKGQIQLEDRHIQSSLKNIVFFDTNLLTIEIWSAYKYSRVDTFITDRLSERRYNLYFLCFPNIAWEPDPLRENPDDRLELFEIYERRLKELKQDYHILKGSKEARLQEAIKILGYSFNL